MIKLFKLLFKFIRNHLHIFLLSYIAVYISWFVYLERTVTTDFHVIHMAIDDLIPFCEVFILAYLAWFVYMTVVLAWLFFKDAMEFTRLCMFVGVGMTVFLIVSTVYPNGHYLRPATFPRDNIFTTLTQFIYGADTATNLFPSVHVFNSLGMFFAVRHSDYIKRKSIRRFCGILTICIILSTVFLKQHSVFDVITAFILAFIVWIPTYSPIAIHPILKAKERKRKKE